MYDIALWKYFTGTVFHKFRSYYNRCIKKNCSVLLDIQHTSMSGILMDLSLPTADTIFHNSHSHILFANQCALSCNKVTQWFTAVSV